MCVYECIYVCMFVWKYVLSYKTCPPGHCHNSFMATGALGHTYVRYMLLAFRTQRKLKLTLQQQI